MKFTYYGHACFHIEIGGKNIILDPFIRPNELASGIDFQAIKADYILVSHGHADHVADLVPLAKQTGAKVVAAYEITEWAQQQGISNVHPMNVGGKWQFDFGTVMCVAATHSSAFSDGSYAGNPVGFVIWNDKECFYYSGDTGLTMDMKLIPLLCPKLDVAIMPIGDNFTMDATQAAMASDFVECDKVIGCHYDTFGYIKIDHEEAKKVFADKGKALILLPIGDSESV